MMFILPEALWSPVVSFYYQFIKGMYISNVPPLRDSFLQQPEHFTLLKIILFIEAFGAFLSIIILLKQKSSLIKFITITFFLALFILFSYVFLYAINLF